MFGGAQPPATQAPPQPSYYEPPPVAEPTPADYAESYESDEFFAPEGEYTQDVFPQWREPVQPGPEDITGAWEPEITLYGDGEHFNEPFSHTFNDWMAEAAGLSPYELQEMYGLHNIDIIQGLYDEGYDYDYISDETGEIISGLWHDFRDEYEAAHG